MAELKRRGDTEKCPACGWRLDDGAYRCPKCRIYFCFKCRARVAERETQYQCANQACACYGKLLCSACVVPLAEPDSTVRVSNENGTTGTLIAGGVAAVGAIVIGAPLILAGAVGLGGIFAASKIAKKMGFNAWGSSLSHPVSVQGQRYLGCIQCKQPVKHLR